MKSSMYPAARFSPHMQWPRHEQDIPVLWEPGNGGTLVRYKYTTAQMTLCAASEAALFPKDRAVSSHTFPFHLMAKNTDCTGSKRNHLYQRCISILNMSTRWPGYLSRVCWMSVMIVADVGNESFQ